VTGAYSEHAKKKRYEHRREAWGDAHRAAGTHRENGTSRKRGHRALRRDARNSAAVVVVPVRAVFMFNSDTCSSPSFQTPLVCDRNMTGWGSTNPTAALHFAELAQIMGRVPAGSSQFNPGCPVPM
jgi:hypothetical protein